MVTDKAHHELIKAYSNDVTLRPI